MIESYYADELENNGKAPGTVQRHKDNLGDYRVWCDEKDIEPENADVSDIDSFLSYLQAEGYADNSISSFYYSLKAYYDWVYAVDESPFDSSRLKHSRYLGSNSGTAEERKKKSEKEEIKYITEEEKEELKDNVPSPQLKNELIIEIMWQTGIRQSEAVLIELDDIDTENREIDIYAPKTDEYRTVYYQSSLDILLEQWINGGYRDRFDTSDSSYLFITNRTEKMQPKSINQMVRKAADNAGIQEITGEDKNGKRRKITSHAIRHGHAVHSLKNGIDITFIKEHMGHSDLSMTQRYLDLVDSDVKDTYQSKFPA